MRQIGEDWELDDGTVLKRVHTSDDCAGPMPCVVHKPTDHGMARWPLLWRDDRRLFERICSHGVGHPDPDQFAYWVITSLDDQAIHGCDGCCSAGVAPR